MDKEEYEKNMQEAAQDEEFLKRTLECQEDFKFVDYENIEEF